MGTVEPDENLPAVIELIREIGLGNREAFGKFFHQFSGLVYATALRILADPVDAEDVAQEVFVMLWEKAPMYDPSRGKPITWVITMTRNKSIDRLRSLTRRGRLYDEAKQEWEGNDTYQVEPFADLENTEKGRLVRSAVLKLNKKQRDVIEMAYFNGLTQQEIASRLSEPLGTVKARIRRGMLSLRKIIESRL
ncbi:sigma-70 family RNA polymerase sigma factor [soil metagenome]